MRKLLLVFLLVLIPLTQADDSGYRICSAKILNNLFDDRESVNERISKINAASSPEELLALADEFAGFGHVAIFSDRALPGRSMTRSGV